MTTPTIVDLDGDGDVEIGLSSYYGAWFGTGPAYIHFWDLEAPINEDCQVWPTYCHDHHHAGLFGYMLPEENPIAIEMTPDSVETQPGDTLDFTVSVTNMNVVYESLLTGLFLTFPDGSPFPGNPFVGPYSLRLPMGASISHDFHFNIPLQAPLGTYTMTGLVGTSPSWIYDADSLDIFLGSSK